MPKHIVRGLNWMGAIGVFRRLENYVRLFEDVQAPNWEVTPVKWKQPVALVHPVLTSANVSVAPLRKALQTVVIGHGRYRESVPSIGPVQAFWVSAAIGGLWILIVAGFLNPHSVPLPDTSPNLHVVYARNPTILPSIFQPQHSA